MPSLRAPRPEAARARLTPQAVRGRIHPVRLLGARSACLTGRTRAAQLRPARQEPADRTSGRTATLWTRTTRRQRSRSVRKRASFGMNFRVGSSRSVSRATTEDASAANRNVAEIAVAAHVIFGLAIQLTAQEPPSGRAHPRNGSRRGDGPRVGCASLTATRIGGPAPRTGPSRIAGAAM